MSNAATKSPVASPDDRPIPIYTIDLSLPPSQRYLQLATDFSSEMQHLTPLFDEVLSTIIPYARLRRFIAFLASLFLRRVWSREETEELRGIAKVSGVDIYFLVALNVLLDSLLGCTSGGVMTRPREVKGRGKEKEGKNQGHEDRMMHFRTLDWGMSGLRNVLVVLEFVRSKSETPGKVIGRSVSYAGFVGCLTGVRENLSFSLNFRPNHHSSTLSLRYHQLFVLFGIRPSIASLLRSTLLSPTLPPLSETTTSLSTPCSAPCYLILCSGTQTTVIEKDLTHSQTRTRTSSSFIIHTNHDVSPSPSPNPPHQKHPPIPEPESSTSILGGEMLLSESVSRLECVQKKWTALLKRHASKPDQEKERAPAVREETLKNWVTAYPVMNEVTHFACILDPRSGGIRFLKRRDEEEGDEESEGVMDPELLESEVREKGDVGSVEDEEVDRERIEKWVRSGTAKAQSLNPQLIPN